MVYDDNEFIYGEMKPQSTVTARSIFDGVSVHSTRER
jgi:hypothetical protein